MTVSLVTGAGGGIGSALVASLTRTGDTIVATDVSLDAMAGLGPAIETIPLDVRDPDAWQRLVDDVVAAHGSLDRVFNIAGVLRTGHLHAQPVEDLALMVEVNLLGVIYGTRAASRVMIGQGSGHVVNIASLAGISPVPGLSGYSATKFGVRGFSLSTALELRPHGVAVTVICPDLTDTGMFRQQIGDDTAAVSFSGRQILRPEDVVAAALEALVTRTVEVTLPRGRGALARLAGNSPRLARAVSPVVTRIGRRNQDRIRAGR